MYAFLAPPLTLGYLHLYLRYCAHFDPLARLLRRRRTPLRSKHLAYASQRDAPLHALFWEMV